MRSHLWGAKHKILILPSERENVRHVLRTSAENVHWGYYDPKLRPVLHVKSGDLVEVYTVSGNPWMVELFPEMRDKIPKELKEVFEKVEDRGPGPHILLGPIFVKGATPEDTLEVTLLGIEPWVDYGCNFFFPEAGSVPEEFPYFEFKCIPIDRKRSVAKFSEWLELPLRPFFGNLGVAPPISQGRITSKIPGPHGGNLDNKELIASSKVYLPIHNDGALFSIGDGHSCQGDGEVDQLAMETCMRGLIKLRLVKGVKIKWPMAETKSHFILMGFNTDLDEALKIALRNTIEFLTSKGFSKSDAYMFCSLSVDFRITQVVNHLKGVHSMVPKDLLPGIKSMV